MEADENLIATFREKPTSPGQVFLEHQGLRGWRDEAGRVHFRRTASVQDYARLGFLLLGLPFLGVGGWVLWKAVTILLNQPFAPVMLVVLAFGLLWTAFYLWFLVICVVGCLPNVLEFDPTRQTVRWRRVPFRWHECSLTQIDCVELRAGATKRFWGASVVLRGTQPRRRLKLWWGWSRTSLSQVTAMAEPVATIVGETLGRPVETVNW